MKWLFLAFLFILDALSKTIAIHAIPPIAANTYPFGGVPIFSISGLTCSLNYVTNTGAAWGTFANFAGLLFILRLAVVIWLFCFVEKKFPIWLIITGALGNMIDYCFYGHVIDFIHFTFWGYSFPIFNIADSCITIGVLSFILFGRSSKKKALT